MEDRPPLHYGNKIYSLTPKFILDLIAYYRKIKLKRYKQRKVQEAKTSFDRNYHIKFKIKLNDSINPQISDLEYEIVIPSVSIFYAKRLLLKDIKEKISVDIVEWEEMSDDEHEDHLATKERYIKARE